MELARNRDQIWPDDSSRSRESSTGSQYLQDRSLESARREEHRTESCEFCQSCLVDAWSSYAELLHFVVESCPR